MKVANAPKKPKVIVADKQYATSGLTGKKLFEALLSRL